MARRVKDHSLESRSARAKLAARNAPYWATIAPTLGLGYRKGVRGGAWLFRFYDEATGARLQERGGTADDILDADGTSVLTYWQAQEVLRAWFQIQQAKLYGGGQTEGAYTIADAVRDYLQWMEHERKTVEDSRIRADALILPSLGAIDTAKLTAGRIREWHVALGASPVRLRTRKGQVQRTRPVSDDPEDRRRRRASANRVLTILKAALNHAWREGRIASDDSWRRVRPFAEADAARTRYLTPTDASRLLAACTAEFRPLVEAALLTGARYGELGALRVEDFNPTSGTVHIRTSKAGKPRHVVLNDEGSALFTRATEARSARDYIFHHADGRAWGKGHQFRLFREACAATGIKPPLTFHELRHTWASLTIMAGAPLMVVAQNLGHADTRMVERHYGHLAQSYVADTIRATAPNYSI